MWNGLPDTFEIDGQAWYNHFLAKRFRFARKDRTNATFKMNLILSAGRVTLVISYFLTAPLLKFAEKGSITKLKYFPTIRLCQEMILCESQGPSSFERENRKGKVDVLILWKYYVYESWEKNTPTRMINSKTDQAARKWAKRYSTKINKSKLSFRNLRASKRLSRYYSTNSIEKMPIFYGLMSLIEIRSCFMMISNGFKFVMKRKSLKIIKWSSSWLLQPDFVLKGTGLGILRHTTRKFKVRLQGWTSSWWYLFQSGKILSYMVLFHIGMTAIFKQSQV